VDLTRLRLGVLGLSQNAGLTGVWHGQKPTGFHFDGTGITVAA
jgi:hypothetical protein